MLFPQHYPSSTSFFFTVTLVVSTSDHNPLSLFSYIHLFLCLCASAFSYPDREQLQTIYSAYLQPVLQHGLGSQASWASTGKTHQLAGSLVQLYEQVFTWTWCSFMLTFVFVAQSCLRYWKHKHEITQSDCNLSGSAINPSLFFCIREAHTS